MVRPALPLTLPATLTVSVAGHPTALPVEEYVAGCVAAELGSIDAGPSAAAHLRDVQAVLCRSFAITSVGRHGTDGFDLCDSTHCQVFRPVPSTVIGRLCREAAERTAGLLLTFQGQVVRPAYHANCGGRTSRADAIWSGPAQPYYASKSDSWCARVPAWQLTVTPLSLLGALAPETARALGGALREVTVRRRDEAGRAQTIVLEGSRGEVVVTGETFRLALLRAFGPRSLRSTRFSVLHRQGRFQFTGRGDGHGVGLCQAGALARAKAGGNAESILSYYFPGTRLVQGIS